MFRRHRPTEAEKFRHARIVAIMAAVTRRAALEREDRALYQGELRLLTVTNYQMSSTAGQDRIAA